MKERYTEEQIIGLLREANPGLPVKELCRKHGFSEPSYYARKGQVRRREGVRRAAPEGAKSGALRPLLSRKQVSQLTLCSFLAWWQ